MTISHTLLILDDLDSVEGYCHLVERSTVGNYTHTHTHTHIYCCSVAQLCPTLGNLIDCSLPGSSVHGFFSQARILEPVAISYSRGSFQLRDRTHLSCKSPALWVDSLPLRTGSRLYVCMYIYIYIYIYLSVYIYICFKQTICRVQNAQSVLTFVHQGDIPGGPVVKTSPFSAEGVSWIPGWGAKIPHALSLKNQNRSVIVTNSIKT